MRKLKKFLVGALSVLTFGVIAVTSAKFVDATSYEQGTVNVSTTTSTNDTKTWTFTTGSDITFNDGDDLYGIYVFKGNNMVTMKANDCFDMYSDKDTQGGDGGSYIYVPIPEDTTSGEITILWTSNNSKRGLYLTSTGSDTYILSSKTAPGATVTFDSTNINNDSTYGTYLQLYSYANDGKNKENKLASIKTVVVGGEYESIAADVSVEIYDGTSKISTQIVKEGSLLTYEPTKLGYNFEGYYTDSNFENIFDYETTAINSSITVLYAKFTFDSNYQVTDSNVLDGTIVTYMLNNLGTSNLANDVKVTDTIYTVLAGSKMQTSSQVACVSTNGAVSTTNKGIKIEAPAAGKIVVSMTTQGTSARNAKFINSSLTEITASSGTIAWDSTAAGNYEVRTIEYPIESAGTYYLGGDNGMRIFTISFTPATSASASATLESQVNGNGASIRFVTTLKGVELTDITSWNVTFTLTGVDNPVTTASFTTLYLAVAGNNGKDAEDGTFYLVYTITEIPTTANGKVLSATMTITFADGSTKTTNASANTIAVTATV